MRFAIDSKQKSFYRLRHFIEFDELLSSKQLMHVVDEIDDILSKKLSMEHKKTFWDYYLAGRDVWRESIAAKNISLSPKLAEIAYSLTEERPLRIALDQVFKIGPSNDIEKSPAFKYFEQPQPLQAMVSLQGVVCGLVLKLSNDREGEPSLSFSVEEELKILTPLPHKKGSGIFFSPEIPLDFKPLFALPDQMYLLIVYCKENAIYRHEERDPHSSFFKKWGYGFGDKLNNSSHPIIFKSF